MKKQEIDEILDGLHSLVEKALWHIDKIHFTIVIATPDETGDSTAIATTSSMGNNDTNKLLRLVLDFKPDMVESTEIH